MMEKFTATKTFILNEPALRVFGIVGLTIQWIHALRLGESILFPRW